MPRGGISKKAVEQARDALLSRGESISIDSVRIELGNTGSKTTIHRYLKELEAAESKDLLSVSLSEELTTLISKLSGRLQDEANEIIEIERRQHAETLEARETRFKQQRETLLATQSHVEKLLATLSRVEQQHQDLLNETQVLKLSAERMVATEEALQQRLDEKDSQISSLEDKHTQAREALNHYRNSVKEQREQDQRRHEHQVQQLQAELRGANQSLTVKQQDNVSLTKQCTKLETQLFASLATNEKREETLRKHETMIHELSTQKSQLQEQFNLSGSQYHQAEQDLAALRQALADASRDKECLVMELNQVKTIANTQKEIMDNWLAKVAENSVGASRPSAQ